MTDISYAVQLVEKARASFYNKSGIAWAGELRSNQRLIGTCGFNRIDLQNRRAELGGELDSPFWGRDLAIEAVKAIVGFGFEKLGMHTIEARLDPDNRGAIHLLKSLGFQQEAHLKECIFINGGYKDMCIYTAFAD